MSKADKRECQKLMQATTAIAKEQGVAQALLGTRKDIEHLYRHRQSKKLLNGWRENVIGQPLLALLQ